MDTSEGRRRLCDAAGTMQRWCNHWTNFAVHHQTFYEFWLVWFSFAYKKISGREKQTCYFKVEFSAFRHYREAAIMAFGSILEGPSKLKLENLIEQAIQPLIVTLTDSHVIIFNICAKIRVFCVVSCKRYCGLGPWKGLWCLWAPSCPHWSTTNSPTRTFYRSTRCASCCCKRLLGILIFAQSYLLRADEYFMTMMCC